MSGGMLSNVLFSLPAYLLYLAALTYAAIQWRRHPKLSLVLGAALVVLLVRLFGTNVLGLAYRYGYGMGGAGRLANGFLQVLFLLGQVLLIAACFVGFAEGRRSVAPGQPPRA